MEGRKIRQIKGALLQCAKENENKPTPTFNICISSLCIDAEQYIRELEEQVKDLQLLLDVQNFLIEPKNKEKKEHLKQNGWVEIAMPCSKEDARDCLTKQEGLCKSTDGLCRIKINLSRLCKC